MDRYSYSPSGWITSSNYITATSTTSSGTWSGVVPVASVPPPPPTPLAWLESEVDRVCGLTRGGLAA